jgi:hypothetical protein
MRSLLSTLDFDRYTPRTYVYCHGDEMSLKVVSSLESEETSEAGDALNGKGSKVILFWSRMGSDLMALSIRDTDS